MSSLRACSFQDSGGSVVDEVQVKYDHHPIRMTSRPQGQCLHYTFHCASSCARYLVNQRLDSATKSRVRCNDCGIHQFVAKRKKKRNQTKADYILVQLSM